LNKQPIFYAMPKVSVIIPNYNHAQFLKQRIDTVVGQSYDDIEVIILDDCSNDDSRTIIEQYRTNPKVSHIVYNETNIGSPFLQWKKGLELARGEYIWIAESDDYCELSLLQTLMDGCAEHAQCVLAYVQCMVINNDEKINRVTTHPVFADCIPGRKYIPRYLARDCTICNASMAIFKKACYDNITDEFTTYKLCGDWAFWTQIAKQGDVFVSARVLNYFRQYTQGVSGKIFATGNNFIEEVRLLNSLKQVELVSEDVFRHALLHKYLRFKAHRADYAPQVGEAVEKAFFVNENGNYERFLKRQSFITLFKIRARRRLNLWLKD